jgi:hypothetical protein
MYHRGETCDSAGGKQQHKTCTTSVSKDVRFDQAILTLTMYWNDL